MCQINSAPMRSTVGHLEVKVPPSFVLSGTSDDVTVREGRRARLRCQARGNPAPEVKWIREDRREISPDAKSEVIGGSNSGGRSQ